MGRKSMFRWLTEREQYCCPYGHIKDHTAKVSAEARRLGIDVSALRYWRKKVARGECTCENKPTCLFPGKKT